MTISNNRGPGIRSVTIIRSDPLPQAGAAIQQAARATRFIAALGLLLVRVETPDLFFADAATSQVHTYEFDVTSNPIQDGGVVTDHVRRRPEMFEFEGIITDTPLGLPPVLIQQSRAIGNFQKLLSFAQERRQLLIATSLQIYDSMVITRIVVPRNADTGGAIPIQIVAKEVRIAQALVRVPAVAAAAAALGAIGPTNGGQQSPTSVTG